MSNIRNIAILVAAVILVIIIWFAFRETSSDFISIDSDNCSIQQNGAYICPADALSNFGPLTVKDTASGNECTISYDKSDGFSFDGPTIDTEVPPGEIAVSLLPNGSVSNIATTGSNGSIAMHINEAGLPDHALTVSPNNQTDQCFSSE